MIVRFIPKEGRDKVLADAVIEFHATDGLLSGFELNGFAVWRGKEGKPFVTSPSRSYTDKNGDKKYFDYLRLRTDPDIPESQKWAVKNWILAEYAKQYGSPEGAF